jgi:cytochrome c oxidase subunit 2
MNRGFQLFPDSASSMSHRVDQLYAYLLGVCGFFALLICVLILYFGVKYRRGSGAKRATGPPRITLEVVWTVIPLLLSMTMFAWGAHLYFDMHRAPADALDIHVVAKQWMWKIQHPEGKREINELHLPVGRPVRLQMISEDVIHSFFVPAFREKQDVLPGRYTDMWFQPDTVGEYYLFCAEYCGTGHSQMIGRIVVMPEAEYSAWLSNETNETPEVKGHLLVERFRCEGCHRKGPAARGPALEGLYNSRVPLSGGQTVIANDEYIRESILDQSAKIVAGFQPLMPTYRGQLGEEEILQIIAYLKSMSREERPAVAPEGSAGHE